MEKKRLYRTENNHKMICGVCGGVAEYFAVDPTIVRVIWALAALCWSIGFWAYLICALVVPKKSTIYPGF